MTHERTPNGEGDSPETDESLPNAWDIPVSDGPDDLDPMTDPDDFEDA